MNIKDIDELFEHSLVISCNDKRLAYFNIVMELFDFPNVKRFQAFTPKIYDIYAKSDKFLENLSISQQQCFNLFNKLLNEYKLCKNEFWLKSRFEKNVFDSCFKFSFINNYLIQYAVMSHLLCVYYAKLNNWPYILIFEDDAFPKVNSLQSVENSIKFIQQYQNEYDSSVNLYLYGTQSIAPIKNSLIYDFQFFKVDKIQSLCGIYAYIISSDIYDLYIEAIISMYLNAVEVCIMNIVNSFNIKLFYDAAIGTQFTQNNDTCFLRNQQTNCSQHKITDNNQQNVNQIDKLLISYDNCIQNKFLEEDNERHLIIPSNNIEILKKQFNDIGCIENLKNKTNITLKKIDSQFINVLLLNTKKVDIFINKESSNFKYIKNIFKNHMNVSVHTEPIQQFIDDEKNTNFKDSAIVLVDYDFYSLYPMIQMILSNLKISKIAGNNYNDIWCKQAIEMYFDADNLKLYNNGLWIYEAT